MMVILKNRPALERNGLQEGAKPLEGRRRKTSQQAVLDPDRLLAVGTAQRNFQRYPMELSSRCPRSRFVRHQGFLPAKLLALRSGVTALR